MSSLAVTGNTLTFRGKTYRCAVGKNGFSANKKEGDGCTPIGTFVLRECWYRADRMAAPKTDLSLKIITPEDGWCDDPVSPEYNRHVRLPFAGSHEKLFREDHCYDLVIPLGYNDAPVIPGKGSAIFLHVAKAPAPAALERDIYSGTEGCIALSLADLLATLPHCILATRMEIT